MKFPACIEEVVVVAEVDTADLGKREQIADAIRQHVTKNLHCAATCAGGRPEVVPEDQQRQDGAYSQ